MAVLGLALAVTTVFNLPGWYAATGAGAVFLILAAPPWRGRIVDAIFGRAEAVEK